MGARVYEAARMMIADQVQRGIPLAGQVHVIGEMVRAVQVERPQANESMCFFFSSRRRHTRLQGDWSSDVCSSDLMPQWRQWLERLYRGPNVIGWSLYYLVERWWDMKLFPRDHMPELHRKAAWPHFWFLLAYAAVFLGTLTAAPLFTTMSSTQAIVLGAVYPVLVFMAFTGWGLYLQHTHPDATWLRGSNEENKAFYERGELLAVHWVMPRWFGRLTHDVMDHPVHHLHPRIPCYRLRVAQARLNQLLGEHALVEKYTLRSFLDTLRRCKLYDFENHRWLDFDGRPTTGTTRMFRVTAKELLGGKRETAGSRVDPLLLKAA